MIISLVQSFLIKLISQSLGIFFLRLKKNDIDNFRKINQEGVLFVANHSSYADPFLIGSSFPYSYIFRKYMKERKCLRFMTAAKYVNRMWYGPLIWLFGAYPVYRSNGNYEKSLRKSVKILRNGQDILMFPNGRKDARYSSDQAKPGVSFLIDKLNPQIIPVFIRGTYNISFLDFFLRKRKVSIFFGEPFYAKNILEEIKDYRLVAKKIMEKVEDISAKH